ncbi:MAG: pantoate--beta-alanine ligase [Gammaproteobacteria bacterium]|nr:pantoate--beta-alanine ligase [Gammaproteobacteria bacterium]
MPRYQNLEALYNERQKYSGNQCGLVPTMGALHEGHLSLIEQAQNENESVWVTIFVNPTQFNNPSDLHAYPISLKEDIDAIFKINPNINILIPSVQDMYPEQVRAKSYEFNGLDEVMEGKDRPGHFNGVVTIVSKLFEAVKPHRAYFGEKDFQQLQIINNWVKTANIPTTIVPCPIVREKNGLAMSSRNELLTKKTRIEAGFIYNTLEYCASNNMNKAAIYTYIANAFAKHPAFTLHYVVCVNENTLVEVSEVNGQEKQRLFVATSVEGVRLIDNIALK